MGRLTGKVALTTGAARGQGHALKLAEEGADIIALDIAQQIDIVKVPMGTREDLEQTRQMVESLHR
jgi:(+)-trans-carveol dehydrogenase